MMGSTQQPLVGTNIRFSPTKRTASRPSPSVTSRPATSRWVMRRPHAAPDHLASFAAGRLGRLDYLIVDLPPGTGDVVISLVQTVPLTGAVVVSTPSDVSLQDARKALEMFAQVNVEVLGIVENNEPLHLPALPSRDRHLLQRRRRGTAKQFNFPFLGSIELIPAIREGGDRGLPVTLAGPKSPQPQEFFVSRKS